MINASESLEKSPADLKEIGTPVVKQVCLNGSSFIVSYFVHKQLFFIFFKTITIKILHSDTNRFTSKIELGDDAGNSHLKQQLITE